MTTQQKYNMSGVFGLNEFGRPKQLADRVEVERSVYDLALERIEAMYKRFDTISVAFSGGKDSTACLQMTLEVAKRLGRLPLDVVFFDEEAIPYQTEDYVRRVARWPEIRMRWYCLPVRHRNACSRRSPWWFPWAPEVEDLWVRPLPPEAITDLPGYPDEPEHRLSIPETNGLLFDPATHGQVGFIMGIRAQESLYRTRALLKKVGDNYIVRYGEKTSRGNLWKVYPIYDWKLEDVWTAPALNGWDYNEAYDVMEAAGMPMPQQRCSPAYGEEPLQGLHRFKTCFPELWDRMSERVPGANAAMLYARTELWHYGDQPIKPDDVSWQEFVLSYVRRFPEREQRLVAKYIRKAIHTHHMKTSDPILAVAHPETGLSWGTLLAMAARGNFKNRKHANLGDAETIERRRGPYAEELARYNERRAAGLPY